MTSAHVLKIKANGYFLNIKLAGKILPAAKNENNYQLLR